MISTRPLLLRSSKQLSLWSSKLGYLRRHPSVASLRFKSTVSVSELEQDSVHVHEKGSGGPSKRPDFDDTRAAFSSKSTLELIRAHAVFSLCNISFLVRNADTLVRLSRKVFGDTITDFGLKHTLFALFCAGEDEVRIKPVLQGLRAHGIAGILDYAAESDSEPESLSKKNNISHQMATSLGTAPPYDYESEAACDRHVDVFLSCIQSVQHVAPDGFAAVKVTALGNPKLLERMSKAVVEAQQFFAKLDENGDGVISREEFEKAYMYYFVDEPDNRSLKELMDYLDYDNKGGIDYITWSRLLGPRDLTRLTSNCREVGPLANAAPTDEELELIETMFQRAHSIAKEAVKCGTRVLIDAEQARFQPAIDNLVLDLQQTYNAVDVTDHPIIFNTYQCYRKNELEEIKADVERSERYNYHFGAKLVRGAYMESERAMAKLLGYPSPINDTIEDTHKCYNGAVDFLLRHETYKNLQVMLATHNQESIERAMKLMDELGIDKHAEKVYFAQLMGMSDNLTFNLGKAGYRAYKYVPYGKVKEVVPYLLRRAQENSAVLGSSKRELEMLNEELYRRFKPSFV